MALSDFTGGQDFKGGIIPRNSGSILSLSEAGTSGTVLNVASGSGLVHVCEIAFSGTSAASALNAQTGVTFTLTVNVDGSSSTIVATPVLWTDNETSIDKGATINVPINARYTTSFSLTVAATATTMSTWDATLRATSSPN